MSNALAKGGDKFGMRICEFSVQGNHVHLIAEAADARALSHGMQGFSIRLARGLNRLMSRRGRVLSDRFHVRILRTPTEVIRVLRYVRGNHAIHRQRWADARRTPATPRLSSARRTGVHGATIQRRVPVQASAEERRPPAFIPDPYSSAAPGHGVQLPGARTYLLSRARAVEPVSDG